eukprot:CAMPEP_0117042574 /NCGR_PEP_ID=MMETSP0472-20121206/29639_1 /TAXON_ID=693140 ORGANISM="Tiarina fusus, Strain LIS" /NCGR_SAMPLE_ID=MMETSP0472 /ASSEMBLY_ACC=CAM_ASM_000603 /LENGTH=378 /DNA_ID=CAMNT_0004753849 /DNA_START=113 /DNA_END=1246 /DNA_ORIENTATION=-
MAISWLTADPTILDVVYYGTTSNSLTMNATSTAETSYDDDAGWNHNVILTNLQPGTTYYYSCGTPNYAFSTQFSFSTMSSSFVATTIAAYGDLGITHSTDTINQLLNRTAQGDFGLYVHMGDISYANDHPLRYEHTWNEWFTEMQPIMSSIPYMVAPGNHESWCRNPICAIPTYNFTTYKEKFRMPGNESGTGTNMFYSFDYYNIHFVAIDTESDYPGAPVADPDPSPENIEKYYLQENWLHDDLSKAVANRANVPWIILFGHRPIYAPNEQSNGIPTGQASRVQSFFEPYLKQYEVDVFLTGHVHAYARTYPIYNNTVTSTSFVNPPSPVHVVAGGAGNREGVTQFPTDKPTWYAGGNDETYGYGTWVVNDETSLTW